ncbi:MAG: ubiquinone/menaquinone biosynthesis C-methylase UbiE [Planctomycetota bacterium]|jgi:ubiquinone/menaquinone biosynthesis C-methylase UbiE
MSLENEIEVFTERYEAIDPETLRIPEAIMARYKGASSKPVFKTEWVHHQLHRDCREGDRVLELGSGDGMNLALMVGARHKPYRLCGSEITLEGCRVSRDRLKVNGMADSGTRLQVADCNQLPYLDGCFDGVVGFNILHHLDLEASLKEVRRVLKPGGWGLFTEPVILSEGLDRARKLIPYYPEEPTEDEHPLKPADFALVRSLFEDVQIDHFEMISRVHSMVKWKPLNKALHRLDYAILRTMPFLRSLYSGSTLRFVRGND